MSFKGTRDLGRGDKRKGISHTTLWAYRKTRFFSKLKKKNEKRPFFCGYHCFSNLGPLEASKLVFWLWHLSLSFPGCNTD